MLCIYMQVSWNPATLLTIKEYMLKILYIFIGEFFYELTFFYKVFWQC